MFDAFSLIERGIKVDKKLLEKKLKYYNLRFDKRGFIESINKKKGVWERELKHLLKDMPLFNKVKACLINAVLKV